MKKKEDKLLTRRELSLVDLSLKHEPVVNINVFSWSLMFRPGRKYRFIISAFNEPGWKEAYGSFGCYPHFVLEITSRRRVIIIYNGYRLQIQLNVIEFVSYQCTRKVQLCLLASLPQVMSISDKNCIKCI